MISYAKLKSGEWGVRVEGPAPRTGSRITVTKKDGSTKTETIAAIVWEGTGVTLCAIAAGDSSGYSRSSGRGGRAPGTGGGRRASYPRTGCSCGSREGITQASDCFSCKHDAE